MPVFKYVNKNFFKKWSHNMAYVLGFFAADGYITVNKRGGQFWCIQIIDNDLLIKIKKVINSTHSIGVRKGEKNEKMLFRLQIGSIEMCDDLRRLGYSEKKTKNLVIPKIPKIFFPNFVRGYFDGDGNVWSGFVHKKRKTQTLIIQTVFTSCSLNFLEDLKTRLNLFGVNKGVVRKGKGNFYKLTYSILSSLKLYKFMYNRIMVANDSLYLQRKKKVFEKFIRMRS